MRPSVGKTGICWDNAVAESFWESLKRECLQDRVFATRADARRAMFRGINWYNTTRLHTTLGGVPPLEWEQQYRQASITPVRSTGSAQMQTLPIWLGMDGRTRRRAFEGPRWTRGWL